MEASLYRLCYGGSRKLVYYIDYVRKTELKEVIPLRGSMRYHRLIVLYLDPAFPPERSGPLNHQSTEVCEVSSPQQIGYTKNQ